MISYRELVRAESTLVRIFDQARPQNGAINATIRKLAKMKAALLPAYTAGIYADKRLALIERYKEGKDWKGETQEEIQASFLSFNKELSEVIDKLQDITVDYPEIHFAELFSLNMAEPISSDESVLLEPFFKD